MDLCHTTLEVDTAYQLHELDKHIDFGFVLNLWLRIARGLEQEIFKNRGYSYDIVIKWSLEKQTTVLGKAPFEASISLWNSYSHKQVSFIHEIKFRKSGLYYGSELVSAKTLAEGLYKYFYRSSPKGTKPNSARFPFLFSQKSLISMDDYGISF